MEWITGLIGSFSAWLRPHLGMVGLALIATLLVIYGHDLNRAFQELVKRLHFLLRVALFVLICAFGYGAVINYLAPLLARLLASLNDLWLGPLVLGAFLLVGVLAERRRYC